MFNTDMQIPEFSVLCISPKLNYVCKTMQTEIHKCKNLLLLFLFAFSVRSKLSISLCMFNELMAIPSNLDGNKWTSSGVITPVFEIETAAKKKSHTSNDQSNIETKTRYMELSGVNVYSHEIAGQLLC